MPDSSGMYLRPDSNCLWLSADHNREQPKPRPHERRAAETLKQAEQAFEDQKTLAEATTGVWEEMEQALSDAARQLRLHLRMPGTPTKNRALSEPPSQGNSPAELAVLVLVPAICPLGCFQLALRALDWRAAPCPRRLLRPSGSEAGVTQLRWEGEGGGDFCPQNRGVNPTFSRTF